MGVNLGSNAAFVLMVVGVILIWQRKVVSHYLAACYRKIGLDVPEERYARQFVYVGSILALLGFLMVTGLIRYL